uniref:Truncated ORF3 n=1 Tax=Porcine epidemic diarrhea virus TaxID=28295 RepID=D3XNX2_PEDV|nr:truncated ORF3 protein [Porcine epidemic diarrhea virus]ADC67073.1 truncated ORF3 protein [Porcine epidemic diarrhea virus]ADQ27448.1 truncated ORF3 [Porcine epidemic diarrhea virus]AFD23291.1 truncated ORF3 protein [Porcine epidemic diarrhea virus]AFE85870.1 truncated ORF3 [Porcine epidemic diarrhea virus]
MFLGLFQYTIDTVVKDVSKSANLSLDAVQELELNVVPIRQASNVTGFLFTSVFIYFFALFKASSLRRNYIMLAARFAVIFLSVAHLLAGFV